MKANILYLITCVLYFTLVSCDGKREETQELVRLNNDRYSGGTFRYSESEEFKTLYPLSIVDIYSYRIASQVYEGLFKFDQGNITQLKNSLVEHYEIDSSQTIYTFKLRQDVFFHDDACFPNGKGRALTANDVAYCFQKACTPDPLNLSFHLFEGIVKGADDYYQQALKGQPLQQVPGITVVDPHTIRIELVKPNAIFLYNLARPGTLIFPKEAIDMYGAELRTKAVGTGPFRISGINQGVSVLLTRNAQYYRKDENGNQLPYLQAIDIRLIKEKKVELMEFKKGSLDMMYRLPADHLVAFLESMPTDENGAFTQFELQREPEMSTQFLLFNHAKGVFKDVNVRKAFNFAIDRQKIVDYVLSGEAYGPGVYGFTPPAFDNYDIKKIKGYDLRLDSASYYLAKAGYPEGKNFPAVTLLLNAEGERYTNVAVEIQKQLKDHLNISIEIQLAPHAQVTEKSMNGDFQLIRMAWVADYPSPENYLWKFLGSALPDDPNAPSYPNLSRYNNPRFDALYEKAITAHSPEEANEWFMQAEQLLMKDAPVMVMWYDEGYRLLQNHVKNFPNNPMQFRDFSEVFFIPQQQNPATQQPI